MSPNPRAPWSACSRDLQIKHHHECSLTAPSHHAHLNVRAHWLATFAVANANRKTSNAGTNYWNDLLHENTRLVKSWMDKRELRTGLLNEARPPQIHERRSQGVMALCLKIITDSSRPNLLSGREATRRPNRLSCRLV